jgi:hypothetical protein
MNAKEINPNETIPGEVSAAIAAALYEMENVHDVENNKLTISRTSRTLPPWNAKIFGLRKPPGS